MKLRTFLKSIVTTTAVASVPIVLKAEIPVEPDLPIVWKLIRFDKVKIGGAFTVGKWGPFWIKQDEHHALGVCSRYKIKFHDSHEVWLASI